MRLTITKSKNFEFLYIQKDLYLRDVRGKKSSSNPSGKDRTTIRVAKLGRMDELMALKGMTREEVCFLQHRIDSLRKPVLTVSAKGIDRKCKTELTIPQVRFDTFRKI